MPYYSVHITGGKDAAQAGREARQMFDGRDADYTNSPNFFYVHRAYDKATLKRNLGSFLTDGYEVSVKRISKREFGWPGN